MTQLSKSLVVATLLGIGVIVAPSLAKADAAKIEPVNPAVMQQYGGDDLPLLSSGGEVVTGNAWCDPITNACLTHPWKHHKRF